MVTRTTQTYLRKSIGSALIITVVLTSLLAIVGVLFALLSRMDKNTVRSLQDRRHLDNAADSLLAHISQVLAADVPQNTQEYWDAYDVQNAWLASHEPHRDADGIKWLQISDVTGALSAGGWQVRNVPIVNRISDKERIGNVGQPADADGDGVEDAKWFIFDNSNPSQPVYAAVRVVDHGAMLNVNTSNEFPDVNDINVPQKDDVDGRHQMQIDLHALSTFGKNTDPSNDLDALETLTTYRTGDKQHPVRDWLRRVVWYFGPNVRGYTPFDLTDELRLRYRYLLNYNLVSTRIEEMWSNTFEGGRHVPAAPGKYTIDDWLGKASYLFGAGNETYDPCNYDLRHLATTINGDRLIDPNGNRMININRALDKIIDGSDPNGINQLYQTVKGSLIPAQAGSDVIDERSAQAAQFVVNLIDFCDANDAITAWQPVSDGKVFYGQECQAYIRQIGYRLGVRGSSESKDLFVLELYNPYDDAVDVSNYRLELYKDGSPPELQHMILLTDGGVGSTILASRESYYIVNHLDALVDLNLKVPDNYLVTDQLVYVNYPQASPIQRVTDDDVHYVVLGHPTRLPSGQESTVVIDAQSIRDIKFIYDDEKGQTLYYARGDERFDRTVIPRWDSDRMGLRVFIEPNEPFAQTAYDDEAIYDTSVCLEDPNRVLNARRRFDRIGDILRVLIIGPNADPLDPHTVGEQIADHKEDEVQARFSLLSPLGTTKPEAGLFQYLCTLDPQHSDYGNPTLNELHDKVKGRININTAPWYVLARLPWIDDEVAQDLVMFRDGWGDYSDATYFRSTGDLLRAPFMSSLRNDKVSLQYNSTLQLKTGPRYPDFSPDKRIDDLEEAHLLFSAVSNLATVRSDVFSVYMVLRSGATGPQQRVFAILDRSDVKPNLVGRVHTVVRQNVPSP